jgi:hypothetical protein
MEDVKLNTAEALEKRAVEIAAVNDKDLQQLGEAGKERKAEEGEKKVEEIRKKHFVEK